ncbi:MAG TPA: T9SS type A sorting domain-containing protein [Paludibacter sp.]
MRKILLSVLSLLCIAMTNSQTTGTLTFSVATAPTGMGFYEPNNVLAIWIEDSSNHFVKTMLEYGLIRYEYLDLWNNASGGNKVDAKTGATKTDHGVRTCIWSGTDILGAVVGDGTYKICMQLTDDDFSGVNKTFTFTKGPTSQTLTPANALPSFKDVSIQWLPANTAIADLKQENLYSVYPNPTKSTAFVSGTEIKKIELCTLAGKRIFKTHEQRLNLSTLPKGLYLVRIYTKTATVTKKIQKE